MCYRSPKTGAIHRVSTTSVWRIRMSCIRSCWENDWLKSGKRSCGIRLTERSWRNVCRTWSSLKRNTPNSSVRSLNLCHSALSDFEHDAVWLSVW